MLNRRSRCCLYQKPPSLSSFHNQTTLALESVPLSVVNGVLLIAWPLYTEQMMNAAMLTEDIESALRLKKSENGLLGRDEIAMV